MFNDKKHPPRESNTSRRLLLGAYILLVLNFGAWFFDVFGRSGVHVGAASAVESGLLVIAPTSVHGASHGSHTFQPEEALRVDATATEDLWSIIKSQDHELALLRQLASRAASNGLLKVVDYADWAELRSRFHLSQNTTLSNSEQSAAETLLDSEFDLEPAERAERQITCSDSFILPDCEPARAQRHPKRFAFPTVLLTGIPMGGADMLSKMFERATSKRPEKYGPEPFRRLRALLEAAELERGTDGSKPEGFATAELRAAEFTFGASEELNRKGRAVDSEAIVCATVFPVEVIDKAVSTTLKQDLFPLKTMLPADINEGNITMDQFASADTRTLFSHHIVVAANPWDVIAAQFAAAASKEEYDEQLAKAAEGHTTVAFELFLYDAVLAYSHFYRYWINTQASATNWGVDVLWVRAEDFCADPFGMAKQVIGFAEYPAARTPFKLTSFVADNLVPPYNGAFLFCNVRAKNRLFLPRHDAHIQHHLLQILEHLGYGFDAATGSKKILKASRSEFQSCTPRCASKIWEMGDN
jgi:hypothetical protein